MVLQQVPDHQHPPGALGGVHGALRVGGGGGERLLHEAVLAGLGDAHGELSVGGDGRGKHHRVEGGIGE